MFSLIVMMDRAGGIAYDDQLPMSNAVDMKIFRRLTTNNVVIMGRRTWESLPAPLPNRLNVVISRTLSDTCADLIFADIETCIDHFSVSRTQGGHKEDYKDKELFVIGGAEIYNYFINNDLIGHIYKTTILEDLNCDIKVNFNTKFSINPKWDAVPIQNETVKHLANSLMFNATFPMDLDTMPRIRYDEFTLNNHEEDAFLDLMRTITTHGVQRIDRTAIGTLSIFAPPQLEFDLSNGNFPMITTRPVNLRLVFEELMWFLRGQTDVRILEKKNVKVWTPNSTREFLDARGLKYRDGDIGPAYGFQFRHNGATYIDCETDYTGQGFDQIADVIHQLRTNPSSRRIMLTLWAPADTDKMALPPCLFHYQFYVADGELTCKMTQRSSDIALAGGWNICTGSLLTYMLARLCNLTPKRLIWSIGDCHIYNNQLDGVLEQIKRRPRRFPKIKFIDSAPSRDNGKLIDDFEYTDIKISGYRPHSTIKFILNA